MSAAVPLRPIGCPTCGRYIAASDQEHGTVKAYCRTCRGWRVVRLETAPPPARLDAGQPVRIVRDADVD